MTKVLLADSQFLTRRAIATLIHSIPGLEIIKEVDNIALFMQSVTEVNPDMVIIDLHSKEAELIPQIERIKLDRNISFLVISNEQNRSSIQRLLGIGIKGILTKNCSEDEITNGIISVSKGGRFFCNNVLELVVQGESSESDCEPTNLTPREYEVLELITRGKSTAQIADDLHVSIHTINSHRKNILRKLHLNSPAELIVYALESGLVKG